MKALPVLENASDGYRPTSFVEATVTRLHDVPVQRASRGFPFVWS